MKLPARAVASICLIIPLISVACAGIGPDNVFVVVNGDSAASIRIANAYALLRDIPPSNFLVLHHLSGVEYVDVDHFRSDILKPTLEAIRERGLAGQIDCISYSSDIPYSVDVQADIKHRPLPQVITQPAAINGLTFLSDLVLDADIDYLRLDINRYARRLLPLPEGTELTAAEQTDYATAMSQYSRKDYKNAIVGLSKLLQTPRTDPNIAYNLACCQALVGDPDSALTSLRKAMKAGWHNYGQTATDPDLASLGKLDEFQQLLKVLQLSDIELQPGVAFTHATGWGKTGAGDPSGKHYMLSTVLGVTAGRGNTVDEVLAYLRRSKDADFTAPKGTIYFERNGDVRSRTREWGFQEAARELEKLGVSAVIEDGVLPQSRDDVVGAMIGAADFDWQASHSTMLPGAIVEHLTSFGGMLNKGAGQTPCTAFLRNGASGSSGTVTEPYALQEKFPTPFIQVQYAMGFTLAEAYYLSVSGPYQLLILGDPLCRPWAKRVTVKAAGLPVGGVILKPLSLRPSVSPAVPVAAYRLYVDGRLLKTAKPGTSILVDPKILGEGVHRLTISARRADPTATEYRMSLSVIVQGPHHVTAPHSLSAVVVNDLHIPLSAKGAERIELFNLGASLGKIAGDHGQVTVPAAELGEGTSILYPVATFKLAGRTLRVNGTPITITVSSGE